MEIKADVKSIDKLKDFFFIVPDYQREYVWKTDDQVEQFLVDIDNEYEAGAKSQSSYFIGSIIIVKNKDKFDVIDGQQRLTTIVLSLCALRDLFKTLSLNEMQSRYFDIVKNWLSDFDMKSGGVQLRLELQYDESKDYLGQLIQSGEYEGEITSSIVKMQGAYEAIQAHFKTYLTQSIDSLMDYARYFLTNIEMVVIESENLSSALKIFETINQRGAGLNAMDLVKNLLFSEAKEADFHAIKEKWKVINTNLKACGEDESPLRFLRYFMMARYHNGVLREDDIYKWIISIEGKKAVGYEANPLKLAKELELVSKRYADLVNATKLMKDTGQFPSVTNIGYINKYMSRQHLVLLLAPSVKCSDKVLEYLAKQIESFFFFSNTLAIQAKYNENLFATWAAKLRGLESVQDIATVIEESMVPYIHKRLGAFKQKFLAINHTAYNPLYRQRFVLGKLENTALEKCGLQRKNLDFFDGLQVEHIMPQTPKEGFLPEEFEGIDHYQNVIYRLGNVTLLEGIINQAVNNYNDLSADWFEKKQSQYLKSDVVSTNLLCENYAIGKDTALNRFSKEIGYHFDKWDIAAVEKRQKILLELALSTWLFNDKCIDQFIELEVLNDIG